jgi:peptide/nickel transport system ATP-binding protein
MTKPLLEVDNLQTYFYTDDGVVKAVDGVSFAIPQGKTLGLVGESGCGKSVTALSIIRLVSSPGRIAGGQIRLHDGGKTLDLAKLPEDRMRSIRGAKISMIFQEPMTSLNPVFTIGAQIMEAVMLHQKVGRGEARERAIAMLRKVKISVPERRVDEYPHQMSGGMRQRVMIAMALACNPRLLIADEPSTALDVTVQAQILELLRDLQSETGMSILIITHDLGVIAEMADEVAVMYASKVAEYAPVHELFANPRHPYTKLLFQSRPKPGADRSQKLSAIRGMVPSALHFPPGCKFHPRCPYVEEICRGQEPELLPVTAGQKDKVPHAGRCHFVNDIKYE